jgi:hypothetical protein
LFSLSFVSWRRSGFCPGDEYDRFLDELDVHESVHRDTIMKVTNKMLLYRLIYFSLSAVSVSGDGFAHQQEHLTVFIASSSIHPGWCLG